jgi:hypothetical protein
MNAEAIFAVPDKKACAYLITGQKYRSKTPECIGTSSLIWMYLTLKFLKVEQISRPMNGYLSAVMTTIKIKFCHGVDSHYEVDIATLLECCFGGIHKG